MKKMISVITALAVAFSASFFSSCEGDTGDVSVTETASDTAEPEQIMYSEPEFTSYDKYAPIAYTSDYPAIPTPFNIRDYIGYAKKLYETVFDYTLDIIRNPVVKLFNVSPTPFCLYSGETFAMKTYLSPEPVGGYGESVSSLPCVLGASLLGIDMTSYNGKNWVAMLDIYLQKTPSGLDFISNNAPVDDCTPSYWYSLYPTMLYYQLATLYNTDGHYDSVLRSVADSWLEALGVIDGNWKRTGFSLKNMDHVNSGHIEYEGMYGVAYIEYMTYKLTGEKKYLDAALSCMDDAESMKTNPYYEIIGSWAPYLAAMINAEQGTQYSVNRYMDWVFTDAKYASHPTWGIIKGNWGGYDAYGLSGALENTDGYAFAMNTFNTAWAVAPTARYAPEYSRDIARHIFTVANNLSLFYGDGLPAENQDDSSYSAESGIDWFIYEGVRNKGKTTPFATGDAKMFYPDGDMTNFSFYSGGPSGIFAAMLKKTDVAEIPLIDLCVTDFMRGDAYPTYLAHNPTQESKTVSIDIGALGGGGKRDLFDAVSLTYLSRGADGIYKLTLEPDECVQLVLLPDGETVYRENGVYKCAGITVTYDTDTVYASNVSDCSELGIGRQHEIILNKVCSPDTEILSFTAEFDGKKIYEGDTVPESVTIDLDGYTAKNKYFLYLTLVTEEGSSSSSYVLRTSAG